MPFGIDPHLGHQHRPVLLRHQRAPVVGERLGQHGHDPVGEIDRGAAAVGGAVERLVGPHVPGDVGDGDQQAPAAGMVRVGLGEHRVVEVARVLAVDGDQRRVAQVEPLAQRAARARSASSSAAGGNSTGMSLAAIEIRLTVRGSLIGPTRSITLARRAARRPPPRPRRCRPARRRSCRPAGCRSSASACGRSGSRGRCRCGRRAPRRGRGSCCGAAAQQADDAGLVGVLAAALQRSEHAVADGGGAGRRECACGTISMRGGGPSFSSSWRRGTASRWPSSSTRTISSTVMSVSASWILECLGAVGGDVA